MLATLGGFLALLAGLLVLLLPLLVPELSRPRDSVWGALVLVLGLVLVTSAERLSGAPMLAVLCGGLLIGRLSTEVGLGRWRQLSREEQVRLTGAERWRTSLQQLAAALMGLLSLAGSKLGVLVSWLKERREASSKARETTKRWVRPEPEVAEPVVAQPEIAETELPEAEPVVAETQAAAFPEAEAVAEASEKPLPPEAAPAAEPPPATMAPPAADKDDDADVTTVGSFAEIEQLIEQAGATNPGADPSGSSGEESDEEAVAEPAADGDGEAPGAGVDNSPLLPPQAL
ncbi:Ycf66 family protein [Synechococcus sp. 1G10]|uniref:Ycf66 family protein n=1 Tax=Synechococcus sp. 1G10 TaxID=2025605 RepID=UPI000B98277F|nr:Ycf66 family protein [Synechococcus sp. 1G10]